MTAKNGHANIQYPMVTYSDGVTAQQSSSAEFQLLIQAISNCAVPLVHQLIQQNPKIIHEKGWHGQTALHKACLIGDQTLCYLLLEAGSDPNALNDFDETPLHYACKRGVPTVVNLLIQKGGNLDAVDKNGMSMCHHAAQTGSVYTLIYLYTLRSEYHHVNKQFQLPLHIACQFGHVDAFKFLLKKEKTELKQMDLDGNNVLHIAAKEGHQVLCWDILKAGGCQLLHEKNKEGYTPADLASQRDKYGHKEIAPILQDLIKHKPKDYIVKDPWLTWFWFLAKPFVLYALLLILIFVINLKYPRIQGYIMLVGGVYIVWRIVNNTHRINHVSRMPNPTFAGAFAAGLLHTTICYLFHLVPDLTDQMMLLVLSLVMLIAVNYFYYVLLRRNPGRVRQSMIDPETRRPMTIGDLCVPQKKMEEFCTVCEIVKPLRTKHCKLCEECYNDMDHHCLFLLKCVASNNHVLFVWFLILCVASMVLFLINVGIVMSPTFMEDGFKNTLSVMFFEDAWMLSVVIANMFSVFWGVNLIRFQLQLVSKGQLTAIQNLTKRESGLTSNDKLWNTVNFLMGKPPYAKDPLLAAQHLL